MSKVKELLRQRMQEIREQMAPLEEELREIEQALEAIERPRAQVTTTLAKPISRAPLARQVAYLLQQTPEGLRNREIRYQLLEKCGRKITGKNLSWHLCKMAREGKIINQGNIWSLASKDEAPPDEEPGGASNITGEGSSSPND